MTPSWIHRPPWKQAPEGIQATASKTQDDLNYINTSDPVRTIQGWASLTPAGTPQIVVKRDAAPQRDDFIYIEPPRIAGSDPRALRATMAAAIARYQKEKAIVDRRLEKKITLAVKGIAFLDLCKLLTKETEIQLRAGRAIADEKVTIFCEQQPLRDIMRQITHLFGYTWARSGEEGAYLYDLFQENRLQLAEQALRDQDLNASLLALDEALGIYQPFLKLSRAELLQQLRDSRKQAPADRNQSLKMEETPLQKAASGSLVAIQMMNQLTPAERETLRNGQEVRFSTDLRTGYGLLAPEMSKRLLETFDFRTPEGSFSGNSPGAAATITLSIDRSELGQLSLMCEIGFSTAHPRSGIGQHTVLATGRSPSTVKPDNRTANKGSEHDPDLQPAVTLKLKSCNKPDVQTLHGVDANVILHIEDAMEAQITPPTLHVNSADVWEEIHRQTGLPIVADYYTHLYPMQSLLANEKKLFDALCQVGDTMGVRWKKEGSFLQCRTASFYWDKMKEVPNRLLDSWRRDREQNEGLPLDDFLEMAKLSDVQLNSVIVGQGVRHCLGLEEWNILNSTMTPRKYDTIRPLARFLADLPRSECHRALSPDGILLSLLPTANKETIAQIVKRIGIQSDTLDGIKMRIEYVPSNLYVWNPTFDSREEADKGFPPIVADKTLERALEAAKKVYPRVEAGDIRRTYGILAATFTLPDGTQSFIGRRPPAFRINR
jgi:hypothetical protein